MLQTYHSTGPAGVAKIGPDLEAIFARGQVAHLNVEPDGYTAAQYAAPAQAPVATDLTAMAAQVAGALADSHGRVLLTFGAEMNGNWTTWGCLPAPQYIALYRAAHAAVDTALDARAIDPRRVRWAYGPNATSSASCGSPSDYFPGHDVVDLLGMSAYRVTGTTVAESVTTPMYALQRQFGLPLVILQTGARNTPDRDAWLQELFSVAASSGHFVGLIWFDAADWAVPAQGTAWTAFTTAIASAPVADRQLEGIFAPHFVDTALDTEGFWEIQALFENHVTAGCASAPPAYCPADFLRRADAAKLVARAFGLADASGATFDDVSPAHPAYGAISALVQRGAMTGCDAHRFCPDDRIQETEFTAILAALGAHPPVVIDYPTTRSRAAILLVGAAGLHYDPAF